MLKQIISNRLREHGLYRTMLEEKKRCWRLNYERAFHLDISPTIFNPRCSNGGDLVPDKSVKTWKPTNPLGYKALFERRCQLQPRLKFTKSIAADSGIRADIEAFPNREKRKGILRRIVQLLKRHRDIMFQHVEADNGSSAKWRWRCFSTTMQRRCAVTRRATDPATVSSTTSEDKGWKGRLENGGNLAQSGTSRQT